MFHPFWQNHKRKVHNYSTGGCKTQSESAVPTLPLKLFMQQDQQQQRPTKRPQRPTLLSDDSSVDLSVYTTESKTTIQYPTRNHYYGRMGSVEWPSPRASATASRTTTAAAAKESTLLLSKADTREETGKSSLSPRRHQASSPSTAPSTPLKAFDHVDDKEEVEDYFDYDYRIQQRRQNSPVTESVSRVSSDSSSSNSHGISKTNRDRYVGPIDLDDSSIEDDDSVAEEREDEIMRNCSSVFRVKGSSRTQGQDNDAGFRIDPSSSILPDEVESEGRNSPIIWTDHEDDDWNAKLEAPPRLSSEDYSETLNRSYHETMQSISFHSIDENKECNEYEEDDDPGAVLLTEGELQKHLSKVQNERLMPSSWIGGYDQWKQEQEYQRRYFASLQRNVHDQKRRQRQQEQQQRERYNSPRTPELLSGSQLSHRSTADSISRFANFAHGDAMDKSITSTIDTEQTEEQPPVCQWTCSDSTSKSKSKRRWKILPKFTGTSKKKRRPKKAEKIRYRSPPRTSSTKVEEPFEVANKPLAPLNTTMLDMNAGSQNDGECKELVPHNFQEERKKPTQPEREKVKQEWMKQERIQRMKEKELQRQRDSNQVRRSGRRYASPCPNIPAASKDSTDESATTPLCCASFDSDLSASKSVTILSPCILCDDAERTHISMPCMHFYFCGGCVNKMSLSKYSKCPVCGAGNVTFARVHT